MDLYGRALVDIAIDLINGYLFCSQASTKVDMQIEVDGDGEVTTMKARKKLVARRFITKNAVKIKARGEYIAGGDKSTFSEYPTLIGPVPTAD
jgi:hypothetical protein